MVIQKLQFPSEEICNDRGMFFHGKSLSIAKGNKLSLQTYFNSFSIGKWRKYTSIDNLRLHLRIEGSVAVKAYNSVGKTYHTEDKIDANKDVCRYKKATRRRIEIETKETSDGVDIIFSDINYDGIIFVVIEALEDAKLLGGEYITDTETDREVDIAVCFCTYKREEFIIGNVNRIADEIINNPASPVSGHIEVFVSDNGQTLLRESFRAADDKDSDRIHIFPNKNLGGAGGFTRAMIEAVQINGHIFGDWNNGNKRFSHVILMDDDIILNPEVLERNFCFLKYIKDEYKNAMIGGELFDIDKRYMQFEAGSRNEGIVMHKFNRLWDMRRTDAVAANEVENPVNYIAWPYCCISTDYIREDNLPIPIFIHYDDVEYGMRNAQNGTILLNGLCIWHKYGMYNASPLMSYYDTRNSLICMCDKSVAPSKALLLIHITLGIGGSVLRRRLNVCEAVYRGLRDYYRGPKYFMVLDPIKVQNEMSQLANKEYGLVGGLIRVFINYIKMVGMIITRHDKVTKEWAARKKEYTSLSFWKKYLDITADNDTPAKS